jgi:hypothetical protein
MNSLLKEKEKLEEMHKQSEKTLEEVPLQSAEIQEPMDLNIDYKNSKVTDIQANYLSINRNMSNIQSNIKFKDNISHIATHKYFNNDLNNYGYEKHTYQYETYNAKKTYQKLEKGTNVNTVFFQRIVQMVQRFTKG